MKNKLFRAVISLVSFSALIGTGFGSWVFLNQDNSNRSVKAAIQVTPINEDPEFGHFQIYLKNEMTSGVFMYYNNANPYLVFDQKYGIYWSNTGKDFYGDYVNCMTIRFYVKDAYRSGIDPELFKVSVDYTLPQAFTELNYFVKKTPDDSLLNIKNKSMETQHFYQDQSSSTNAENEYGFVYYVYQFPRYVFAPGREPQNEEELNQMREELGKVKEQIKFNVTVTYNNQKI